MHSFIRPCIHSFIHSFFVSFFLGHVLNDLERKQLLAKTAFTFVQRERKAKTFTNQTRYEIELTFQKQFPLFDTLIKTCGMLREQEKHIGDYNTYHPKCFDKHKLTNKSTQ